MTRLGNFGEQSDRTARAVFHKRVLVVGLGRFGGGVGVTRWLARQGAFVTVTDQSNAESLRDSIDSLRDLEISFKLGGHDRRDLDGIDLVVVNPAVDKKRSAFFQAIRESDVEWTTEMNLFAARCPAPVIGVTGSFGKSTTSAMLAWAMRNAIAQGPCRFSGVHLGGNIGYSLLGDLDAISESDVVVLEMSDAQLEDLPRINWAPALAVITNIQPHHLDRHESFAGYVRAKLNILAGRPWVARDAETGVPKQQVVLGALHPEAESVLAGRIDDSMHKVTRPAPDDRSPIPLSIPGAHNQVNAQMTVAVLETVGIDGDRSRRALQGFRGLPHRLEWVASIDGVDFINDSKSTAPGATAVAVEALVGRSLIVIVGGKRKEGVAYDACASVLVRRSRAVVCMGECASDFAEALSRAAPDRTACVVDQVASLEQALSRARFHARRGDVILFSPGAASFDAYANFTERGAQFVRLVTEIEPSTCL